MEETLKKVGETLTNEAVLITVELKHRNFWQRLWKGKKSRKRTFHIQQVTLGNLIRIATILNKFDKSLLSGENILESNYQAIQHHGRDLATIVAIALENKRQAPGQALIDFVEAQFTTDDLLKTFSVIIEQMDITNFMRSIISIKGINILAKPTVNAGSVNGVSL